MAKTPAPKPAPAKSTRTHDVETRKPQFPVTWIDESASEFGRAHDDGHTGMTPPKQPRTL